MQPALTFKFPGFTFAEYQLAGIKDFIVAGEKAGYFKLVNTGDIKTSYLARGTRVVAAPAAPAGPTIQTAGDAMAANDPRRLRWMSLAMEAMMMAERADQLVDAIHDIEALSPEFDAYLAAEGKAGRVYPVRGKIQRLREFLKTCREKGEAQAVASWQVSRMMLRMPKIPPVKTAAAAQSLIWSLLQGNSDLSKQPLESLDNVFFAVLNFSREQMMENKSWDWVAGLNLLEAEARAIPRPVAQSPSRRTLLGGNQPPPPPTFALDEQEIIALTNLLRSTAGANAAQPDDTPIWQAYVNTPNIAAAYQYLTERPKLAEDERLLNWLEDGMTDQVRAGAMAEVEKLANKASLIIAIRQFGLQQVRQQSGEIKLIFESILESMNLLGVLLGFLDAPTTDAAVAQFQQHPELADEENIGPLIDDQTLKAIHQGEVERYRRYTERADLWRNLAEFGIDDGLRQHQRFLAAPRDDNTIQAEIGIVLLTEATDTDARLDVFGRYPAVTTQEALEMITGMLERLSFQNADIEEYNRYHDVKRLIERCLQIGVDRALSELK
jgi:hypothetical protein